MQPSDYGPFPYLPITRRPKFRWPGGARVALWVIVNVEIFPLDRPLPRPQPGKDAKVPNVRIWGERDYGNRVGIWRVMEILRRFGIRATAATNSLVCAKHPEIVAEGVRLGWEFIGHNRTNALRLNEIPPEEERGVIREVFETLARATGRRPVGWLGAGRQETWNTLDHLVAEGCLYVADWPNDDQPYLMEVGGQSLVSVPYSSEINDFQAFHEHRYPVAEFEGMIRRHFDVMYREGAESGRVVPISLHPYLIGLPHRVDCLASALDYICGHDGVWLATGEEIARHFLELRRSSG
ncbi:MAG: polysaccharide deacetylase family protein [Proteobacteria bacterium]|nr:polysaccharide deacetylase family protein [Pseudomonadota bacterium]